jgi:hypothetical protein
VQKIFGSGCGRATNVIAPNQKRKIVVDDLIQPGDKLFGQQPAPRIKRRRSSLITGLLIVAGLLALLDVFLSGCTTKPLTAPSGGAVQGGLNRVQIGAERAEAQRGDIVKHATVTRSNLQRARDKEVLIDRWREYRARQPKPSPTP